MYVQGRLAPGDDLGRICCDDDDDEYDEWEGVSGDDAGYSRDWRGGAEEEEAASEEEEEAVPLQEGEAAPAPVSAVAGGASATRPG
eukprot:581494-Pyramimonas_sp.AAC.1